MIFPEHSIIAIEQCTLPLHYNNAETVTNDGKAADRLRVLDDQGRTVSVPMVRSVCPKTPEKVTVRVRDLVRGLQTMASSQLVWLEDLGDDPIVLTRDFYEVFVVCQQVRRAA